MPKVHVNGIQIYYEIHGGGESLVFIGGLANDLSDYTERTQIISLLAQKYQVIMLDNRGAGRSDKPDAPYSIEMMADDTVELLRELGIKQVNILGISMGGRIALDLAIRYPQLVKKLVLVSTGARIIWTLRRFLILGLVAHAPVSRSKYPQPKHAFLQQRKASSAYNGKDKLSQIRVPTLILHGKKDSLAPYKLAEELHKGIKNSQLITFDGGHMFLLFKQKEFVARVINFLKEK